MPTPLTLSVPAPAGWKLVARLALPSGKATAAGTTVAGGSVTGTATVPTSATAVYVGLVATADPTLYAATATIGGTVLPDSTAGPYGVLVRHVADGTTMTSYSAVAAAFEASADEVASGLTDEMLSGYLLSGVWVNESPAGRAANAAALLATTIDGESLATVLAINRAVLAGQATATDNGNGTTTLAFKRPGGATAATIVYNPTTGARS